MTGTYFEDKKRLEDWLGCKLETDEYAMLSKERQLTPDMDRALANRLLSVYQQGHERGYDQGKADWAREEDLL